MTSKVFNDSSVREFLELTAMFDALSPAFRAAVTLRALRARDHVATEAGRALDSAIRGSIRLIGYTNPALAISSVLLEPVANSVAKSEKLAGATLRVWAESHEDLQRLVLEHLGTQGIAADYPDFAANRFRGFWDEDSWQRQMDWIVELTEDWAEDDIALMLCYVSGKTILFPDGDDDEDDDGETGEEAFIPVASLRDGPAAPVAPIEEDLPVRTSEPTNRTGEPDKAVVAKPPDLPVELAGAAILAQCIDYLESLTPEDWNWDEAIPDFAEAVGALRELKAAQRERRTNLATARGEIQNEFAQDLEFLEQDISVWSPEGLTDLGELDRTLEMAAGLKRLLAEYREVRRTGNTLSEEMSRRERRFALEPRILDTMGLLAQAMSGNRGRSNGPAAGRARESETESAEPSGLRSRPGREPPPRRDGYQRELIYEPVEDAPVASEFADS